MQTKITVDMLSENSVSIVTQQTIISGEVEYAVGEKHRKAYINSAEGREELKKEVAEPYLTAILAVWGSTPTVIIDDKSSGVI